MPPPGGPNAASAPVSTALPVPHLGAGGGDRVAGSAPAGQPVSLLSEYVRANCSVILSVSPDEGEPEIDHQGAAAQRGREPLAGRDRHDSRGGRPPRDEASGPPGGCGRRCWTAGRRGSRTATGAAPRPGGCRTATGRGSSSSPGRSTGGTTTPTSQRRSRRTRESPSAGRRCGASCAARASPRRAGGGHPGTGAAGSAWPRRACSSRSTGAGTTGSRAGGPGSPWWAGSTTRPGSSSGRSSANRRTAPGT